MRTSTLMVTIKGQTREYPVTRLMDAFEMADNMIGSGLWKDDVKVFDEDGVEYIRDRNGWFNKEEIMMQSISDSYNSNLVNY